MREPQEILYECATKKCWKHLDSRREPMRSMGIAYRESQSSSTASRSSLVPACEHSKSCRGNRKGRETFNQRQLSNGCRAKGVLGLLGVRRLVGRRRGGPSSVKLAAGRAEPTAAADGVGITAFRGMKSLQPTPLLCFVVRPRRAQDHDEDSLQVRSFFHGRQPSCHHGRWAEHPSRAGRYLYPIQSGTWSWHMDLTGVPTGGGMWRA